MEPAEKAWRHIVVGPDGDERVRDQAIDQHAKGALIDDDDQCEPEPDGTVTPLTNSTHSGTSSPKRRRRHR